MGPPFVSSIPSSSTRWGGNTHKLLEREGKHGGNIVALNVRCSEALRPPYENSVVDSGLTGKAGIRGVRRSAPQVMHTPIPGTHMQG